MQIAGDAGRAGAPVLGAQDGRTMRPAVGAVKAHRRPSSSGGLDSAAMGPQPLPARVFFGLALGLLIVAGCADGPVTTPPIRAGTPDAPRDVNLIARDYAYVPATLDLVPGETILLHVINGGLVVHEAVIGDAATQAAWELAEAATVGAPPGPTPVVVVPPETAGLRVVVESGQRVDLRWTVPVVGPTTSGFLVGCHIPGHFARGMVAGVRWVGADGQPLDGTGPGAAGLIP